MRKIRHQAKAEDRAKAEDPGTARLADPAAADPDSLEAVVIR